MHENKIARVHKIERSQICTKSNLHVATILHEGTKMNEDDFAPRVNFARECKNTKKKEQKN